MPSPTPISTFTASQAPRSFDAIVEPCIVRGAAASWPIMQRRSPDWWRSHFGTLPLHCNRSDSGIYPDFSTADPRQRFATVTMPISELLDQLAGDWPQGHALMGQGARLYGQSENGPLRHPHLSTLLDHCEFGASMPRDRLYSAWLWMSGRHAKSVLHYDNNGCHNLTVQLNGRKRVWLFPPERLPQLYPFPATGSCPAHNCSQLDIHARGRARRRLDRRFPGHALAQAQSALLEVGDLLVIPAHWLHAFAHLGAFNLNINAWWKPALDPDDLVQQRTRTISTLACEIRGGPHPIAHQLLDASELATWPSDARPRIERADRSFNRPT